MAFAFPAFAFPVCPPPRTACGNHWFAMAKVLHVCLYNTDPDASQELQAEISQLNFVRLDAEVSTPEDLAAAIHEYPVNLIFFHMNPFPAQVVEVIDSVSTRHPELAMVAISGRTDPEAILAPMRAGCDQFVCKPIDPADLATAVARVANKRLMSHTQGRCICVAGASGGAGATSIACNLALEIGHLADAPCALIDLDLQFGDIAGSFDCEPRYSLHDLAESGTTVDRSILASTLVELPCKVAVLARPEAIEHYEGITPELIHNVIELLTGSYESVVVDLPRRLDPCTFSALRLADLVLIVCQLVVPSIRNARRYYDVLARAGIPEDRIEVLVNRVDSGGRRITTRDLEETIKKPVFATIPNDYEFVARSLDYGRPVAALEHNNPVRAAIRKIARKIIAEPGSEALRKDTGGGLFRRLFAKRPCD